jgi:hypothetical protein
MNQPFHSVPQLDYATQPKRPIQTAFDYTSLDAAIAQQVQTAAQRISHLVRQTMKDLLLIGRELLTIKQALPHGQFGSWLKVEFGWTERMARHFMAVAERFGPKTETISDLRIEPTAAYLLAAPSSPEEAIAVAIERAQRGESITAAIAREILSGLQKKRLRHARQSPEVPAGKLLGQLLEALESFRRDWSPQQFPLLVRQLREFADSLEQEHNGRRTAEEP